MKKCPTCKGSGEQAIARCPLDIVPRAAFDLIDLAGLWEKGIPPVSGGVLDQAKAFMDAARAVWAEEARWKAKRRAR